MNVAAICRVGSHVTASAYAHHLLAQRCEARRLLLRMEWPCYMCLWCLTGGFGEQLFRMLPATRLIYGKFEDALERLQKLSHAPQWKQLVKLCGTEPEILGTCEFTQKEGFRQPIFRLLDSSVPMYAQSYGYNHGHPI